MYCVIERLLMLILLFIAVDRRWLQWTGKGPLQYLLDISQRHWRNILTWSSISMIVSLRMQFDSNDLNIFLWGMLIFYICSNFSAWNSVSRELDMCHNQPHSNSSNYRNGASVTYYQEREPNPHLKGTTFCFLSFI